MIEKISKLLAKAEAAGTPEEAEAYFEKAQSLAASYSIDLAVARARTVDSRRQEEPVVRRMTVGERGKHVNRHLIQLMLVICNANDVRIDIANNSTYVVCFGFPSDIAAAEQLWLSLSGYMVREANAYIKAGEWRGVMVRRLKRVPNPHRNYYGEPKTVERYVVGPLTAQAARSSWYEGFTSRIGQRLKEARRRAEESATAAEVADTAGDAGGAVSGTTALALRKKEVAVSEHYAAKSRARGSWRGGSRSNGFSDSAAEAGAGAADRASLGGNGSLSGARGRLGA
jgi:Protein of unknown function (DUF2786)